MRLIPTNTPSSYEEVKKAGDVISNGCATRLFIWNLDMSRYGVFTSNLANWLQDAMDNPAGNIDTSLIYPSSLSDALGRASHLSTPTNSTLHSHRSYTMGEELAFATDRATPGGCHGGGCDRGGQQCYKCEGYGHIPANCSVVLPSDDASALTTTGPAILQPQLLHPQGVPTTLQGLIPRVPLTTITSYLPLSLARPMSRPCSTK